MFNLSEIYFVDDWVNMFTFILIMFWENRIKYLFLAQNNYLRVLLCNGNSVELAYPYTSNFAMLYHMFSFFLHF